MTANELRIIIAIIGVIVFTLIWLFGRPKRPKQGRRTPVVRDGDPERIEPTFGESELSVEGEQAELGISFSATDPDPSGAAPIRASRTEPLEVIATPSPPKAPLKGVRPEQPIERIVTLFVASKPGELMHGANLVVAAEKAGLTFGDMGIFHRLVSGKSEAGPIFSMANMVKPGNFDMRDVDKTQTPGVSFFMALPGPISALDAWDVMLPTVQRFAELMDANVLDEERNALGRQRIAHLRDELRAWDRKQDRNQIRLR
jgi:cell division protein ZipA